MTDATVIGLEKGTVRLVEHRDEWDRCFAEERDRLARVLAEMNTGAIIQHVGSTAVRGLRAKPIIDIAVGVRAAPAARDACRLLVEKGGYEYVPAANQPGMIFLAQGQGVVRQFHVHVTIRNTRAWHNLVAVRDYLRRYPTARRAYERVKVALAKKYSNNRPAYATAKSPMITGIASKALWLHESRRIAAVATAAQKRERLRSRTAKYPLAVMDRAATLHLAVMRSATKQKKDSPEPSR